MLSSWGSDGGDVLLPVALVGARWDEALPDTGIALHPGDGGCSARGGRGLTCGGGPGDEARGAGRVLLDVAEPPLFEFVAPSKTSRTLRCISSPV